MQAARGAETLAGALNDAKKAAGGAEPQVSGLSSSVKGVTPELSGMNAAGGESVAAIGAIGASAMAAVAGVAALGVVIGGLTIAGAKLAVEQVELKQELVAGFQAFGSYAGAGEDTLAMVNQMASVLPQSRKEIAGWTQQFQALGVTDLGELRSQLTSTASAAALIKGGGDAYTALSTKIQTAINTSQGLKIPIKGLGSLAAMGIQVSDVAERMGVSSKELAGGLKAGTVDAQKFGNALQEALQKKGAGPLANMTGDIGTLVTKAKESFSRMFDDINIEPAMAQVKSFFSILDDAQPSGKAMKSAITGAFNFIFSTAAKVIPYVKHFFLDVIILSLKTYIYLKKHWTDIKAAFMGAWAVLKIVGALLALSVSLMIAPAVAAVAAITGIATAIMYLIGKGLQAQEIGKSFVSGLVQGITDGFGIVKDAAVNLGKAAMSGIKGVLGIASPSKAMMQFGVHTSGGMAEGIRGGTSEVTAASEDMGEAAIGGAASGAQAAPPQPISAQSYAKAPAQGAAPGAGPSGGGTTIQGLTIQITAPQGVTGAIELTEIAVATIFERLALQAAV